MYISKTPLPLRNPARAATSTIRGYFSQIIWSVIRWFDIQSNELLVCEGNEDIDQYLFDEQGQLLSLQEEQLKDLTGKVSARNKEVYESIFNFLLAFHQHSQDGVRCSFIFTTSAQVAQQQAQKQSWTNGQTTSSRAKLEIDVLHTWSKLGEFKENPSKYQQEVKMLAESIHALVKHYLSKEKLATDSSNDSSKHFTKAQSHATNVRAALTYLDSDPKLWALFLSSVSWNFAQDSLPDLYERLQMRALNDSRTEEFPSDIITTRLVIEAFKVASKSKLKERILTREKLNQLTATITANLQCWIRQRDKLEGWINLIDKRFEEIYEQFDAYDRRITKLEDSRYFKQRLPPPFTAPKAPQQFVERPKEFEGLVKLLLADDHQQHPVAITTALQGGGGFGKTTLAQAICHDERVKRAFSDGILWVDVGQTPNLLDLVHNQIKLLSSETVTYTNSKAAMRWFQNLLTGKRVLVVLDDVWLEKHVKAFLSDHPTCVYLITTRRQDLATWIGAQTVDVNEMTTHQATQLLIKWLDESSAPFLKRETGEAQPLQELAQYLGEWPLLLSLVAGQLRDLVLRHKKPLNKAIANVRKRLDKRGFAAFDRTTEKERNRAISISLGLSLEQLDDLCKDKLGELHQGGWRERFMELAVFRAEVDIPFATVFKLWQRTTGLDEIDSEDTLHAIQALSLFNRYDPEAQTIGLHLVIRAYLAQQQKERLSILHREFLDAHRPSIPNPESLSANIQLPTWADMPHDEPYLWDYLAYHLTEAGCGDGLVDTVKELRYLAVKSFVRTVYATEADLLTAELYAPHDHVLRLLRANFANASHLVKQCHSLNNFAATLHCRLQHLATLAPLTSLLADCLIPPYLTVWRPLPDLPHPALIRTLTGHSHGVYGCAINADGKIIVSGSGNGILKVWDGDSGEERFALSDHRSYVRDCAVSANGDFIVSASDDQTVKVWNGQSGKLIDTLTEHTKGVIGCTISANGRIIVSASHDKTLKVWQWNGKSAKLLHTLRGHTNAVRSCATSIDGKIIVSASDDMTLKVWDGQSGALIHTLSGHTMGIKGCAVSFDGQIIASASHDKTVKVWNGQSGKLLHTLSEHTELVKSCAISADGQVIVSASYDKTVKVWDSQSGTLINTLSGHTSILWGCAISADKRFIISSSLDDYILKVWDGLSKSHATKLRERPIDATINDNIRLRGSVSKKRLLVWNTRNGEFLYTGTEPLVSEDSFAVNTNNTNNPLIVSASENILLVRDANSEQTLVTLSGHTSKITSCVVSVDDHFIVSTSDDKILKVWNAHSGQLLSSLSGFTDLVECCAVNSEQHLIIVSTSQYKFFVWDGETGQKRFSLSGHTDIIKNCAISLDGSLIVSASYDHTLKVWDVHSGKVLTTLNGHTHLVMGCAISADNRFIASTSIDKTLRIWDTDSGTCLAIWPVDGWLYDCTWLPDGKHIVAGGALGFYFLRFVFQANN